MTKFEECRTKTGGWNARLDRVEADGRFHATVHQTQSDYNKVVACMKQEWEAGGRRWALPEPNTEAGELTLTPK